MIVWLVAYSEVILRLLAQLYSKIHRGYIYQLLDSVAWVRSGGAIHEECEHGSGDSGRDGTR